MRIKLSPCQLLAQLSVVSALALWLAAPASARVLDNFNDNTKTGWQDFSFVPPMGFPSEISGQLRFELPPAGQALFSASQKITETFTLQEGREIEFRVDVIQAGGKDSFAVLAFIPVTGGGGPGTLQGYGFAKSTTDVLLTKGINKYFMAANPDTPIKNENITLVLSMRVKNGNVYLRTQVLDKDANDAVIFDFSTVDTPNADVMADGTDTPPAPYITSGYFTLYCYEDFDAGAPENPYFVYYDNAEVFVTDTAVLDDFNDGTKTSWQDFSFVPPMGFPSETSGQFRFELPPAGQSLFSASQKVSRVFDLQEGERTEFRVDVIQAGLKDSFAVLAFIPVTGGGGPGTLQGYGFAKSLTDVLITKGINKYFYDENPPEPVKNENITLGLTMTVRNGTVYLRAQVLDKDANDAVIFERTVVDGPGADVMAGGTDSPPAPYITSGYFTLYCYEDFDAGAPENPYFVYYDNAVAAAAPVTGNTAPIISDVQPADYSNFLPTSTRISFHVADDKALNNSGISVLLNGQTLTAANGLTITGTGNSRDVSFGGLAANVNYVAVLQATDSDNASTSRPYYFDTFLAADLAIEIEDYNFGSGHFIDNPAPIAEGWGPDPTGYANQLGTPDVDYSDTRADFRDVPYRPEDHVRMQHSLDVLRQRYVAAGGADAGVYDYDVGDIAAGEWMNYTRTFRAGSYEVYLRVALANMEHAEVVLEKVTGDTSLPDQATQVLGSFLPFKSGFQYRNVPLTDGLGLNKVVLRLTGVQTLRLRQATSNAADGGAFQNYLLFVPVADPGLQRATVADASPAPGTTVTTVTPRIQATILNRDTSVRVNTITLSLNGVPVTPTVTANASGASLTYALSPLPASEAVNTARIVFTDSFDVSITNEWTFAVSYKSLDPANRRSGPGQQRGLSVRVVQAPRGSGLENSLARADAQLAPNSTIPAWMTTNLVADIINYNETEGSAGYFPDDILVPGLVPEENGTDDFAMDIRAYLELAAGVYRFGAVTDDGYKIASGAAVDDLNAPLLAYRNGGTANETFDFVVTQTGFYPFRFVWYERGGAAHGEWFSVNLATGERTLINDPATPSAIKAYVGVAAPPPLKVEFVARLGDTFVEDTSAVIDSVNHRITLPQPNGNRFYRLRGATQTRITGVRIDAANLVLDYTQ